MRNLPRATGLGIAAALFSLPALAQHGSTTVVNPYTSPEYEQAGRKLFRSQCAGCHGPDGAGTGAGPNLASGTLVHGGSDEARLPHHLERPAGNPDAGVFIQRPSDLGARNAHPRPRNRARRKSNQRRPRSRRRHFPRELFPLPSGRRRWSAERSRPHRHRLRGIPMPSSATPSPIPIPKSRRNTGPSWRPLPRDKPFAACA